MTSTDIIHLINHPVSMLILGSSVGWLFISFVWKPLKEKTCNFHNHNRYQKEVFLRLDELKICIENQYSSKIISNLIEGKTTIKPEFINWQLRVLIHSGWSEFVYRNIYATLSELEDLITQSDVIITKPDTTKGLLLLENPVKLTT